MPATARGATPGATARPREGAPAAATGPSVDAAAERRRREQEERRRRMLRYLMFPVLLIVASWWLLVRKDTVLGLVPALPGMPSLPWPWRVTQSGKTLAELLPVMPSNMLEAYNLGMLYERLQAAGEAARMPVLQAVSDLLGRNVTPEELHGVREQLVLDLKRGSVVQRVMGFFSFVNLLWLAAIVGITISVWPAMHFVWELSEPLRNWLREQLAYVEEAITWFLHNVLRPAYEWLVENVLIPVYETLTWFMTEVLPPLCVRLHEWGVWELLVHVVAFVVLVHAARMQTGASTYVALSGLVLCAKAWLFSAFLHGRDELKELYHLECALVAALVAPHAILHQSSLIGYATVAAALCGLGLSAAADPFCYIIGFESEEEMQRACVCTGLGLVVFQAISAIGVDQSWLSPFSSAVSVLGGICHYLGLLIITNEYYHPYNSQTRTRKGPLYVRANVTMLGSLLASQAYGHIYGVYSLANTSTTIAVLWVMDKIRELNDALDNHFWFLFLFGGSVAIYYAALWLHGHPDFVVAMFQ
eukprot:TRINITY_DN8767_c1_g1_i7.p1 TRINITY_DN8767_c1_g1~~TRINITY_DN8767_c1_g1_i7.p1  ORF type:complete len:532 (+),score=79.71 TRINITY_DN8767_c1_g1_i7:193-1788(+)